MSLNGTGVYEVAAYTGITPTNKLHSSVGSCEHEIFSLKPDFFFILAYVRNENNEIFNVSQKLSPNYKLPLIFSSNSILKRNKQVYKLGYLHMS